MCFVSDKIKFCTCATGDFEKLKHYWILYRFNNNKQLLCMGSPMIPTSMIDLNFEVNKSTLLARINEPDAFDVSLQLKSKDLFEIVINNHSNNFEERFNYAFEFSNGKWVAVEPDPFKIMNEFDEEQFGKIKNALKRKSRNT